MSVHERSRSSFRPAIPSDAVLVALAWLLVALLRAAPRLVLQATPFGASGHPWEALVTPLASSFAWALLTPVVARVCRRYPVGQLRPLHIAGIHALLAIPFLVAHAFLTFPPIAALSLLTFDPRHIVPETWFLMWLSLPRQISSYIGLAGVLTWVQALRRTRRAARREARLAAELAEAELDGLRARLSPELFFRALDTALAKAKDRPGDAEEILVALGQLLRRATDRAAPAALAAEREALDALLAGEPA